VREVGAEWLAYQALDQLKVDAFLEGEKWDEKSRQLALTQIASRAVYPASEYRTSRWIKENSAICEVTGYPMKKMTKDKLYKGALALCAIKDKLEKHLSKKTNELFDLQDKIVLYDLTNTYFEGRKSNSKLAKFGRSKEKRSDAKLVVLALVVNPEGFIKYSNVFEGNMADSKSLEQIIDNLRSQTSHTAERALVIIDAGIATEDNLKLIVDKGYDYLCVARIKPKDYTIIEGEATQVSVSNNGYELSLQKVKTTANEDYYLRVNSPIKQLKEAAMKEAFGTRFEEGLTNIEASLHIKQGTKKQDKVHQRIGRLKQKYPSISGKYDIEVGLDAKGEKAISLTYKKDPTKEAKKVVALGEYFLRSNIAIDSMQQIWDYYNTIRDIESVFRCLKTDLDLRPVYHKNDDAMLAHIHLALLAYWLVNTIRHQLKAKGVKHSWTELVRIAKTQKMITTSGRNNQDEGIAVRKCSEPNQALADLYDKLNYKSKPFTKRKSVVHKSKLKKTENHSLRLSSPP
jgi:transposase